MVNSVLVTRSPTVGPLFYTHTDEIAYQNNGDVPNSFCFVRFSSNMTIVNDCCVNIIHFWSVVVSQITEQMLIVSLMSPSHRLELTRACVVVRSAVLSLQPMRNIAAILQEWQLLPALLAQPSCIASHYLLATHTTELPTTVYLTHSNNASTLFKTVPCQCITPFLTSKKNDHRYIQHVLQKFTMDDSPYSVLFNVFTF